jgi:SSS family solute:Na+ symporter
MTPLDWAILGTYVLVSLGIGIALARRGARSLLDFFAGSRALPWWLVGTSMAATTFSVDTPLYVTGLVARRGIAGNWEWWAFAISHVLMIYLFARLWRRAGVVTDMELAELRYHGAPAATLRAVRAFLFAVPINAIGMGYAMLAMRKVIEALGLWDAVPFDLPGDDRLGIVVLVSALVLVYAGLAGLWGVVATDFVQFVLALGGAVLVTAYALADVGGLGGLRDALAARGLSDRLEFVPWSELAGLSWTTFVAYLGIQWWAWRNSDGGGMFVQRFVASRTEEDAARAAWLFNVLHYAVRTWPWILAGLAALVLLPELEDPELGYPLLLVRYLPPGLLGLVVASLFAAFMSTVSTQINWGASYLVNDLYARFLRPRARQAELVTVGRLASALLVTLAAVAAYHQEDVGAVFRFMIAIGTGPGLVLILRWFWWRVNAWAEIAAMGSGLLIALASYLPWWAEMDFGVRLAVTAFGSLAVWVPVMWCTRPEPESTLVEFYRRARPGGPGWRRQREATGLPALQDLGADLRSWAYGTTLLLAIVLGSGAWLLGRGSAALAAATVAAIAGACLRRESRRRARPAAAAAPAAPAGRP